MKIAACVALGWGCVGAIGDVTTTDGSNEPPEDLAGTGSPPASDTPQLFPEPGADPPPFSAPRARARRLSGEEYLATLAGAFRRRGMEPPTLPAPFAEAAELDRFSTFYRSRSVGARELEVLLENAVLASESLVAASECGEEACRDETLRDVASSLFRRSPSREELDRITDAVRAQSEAPDEQLGLALQALLLSPHFLFHSEVGRPEGTGRRLTSHETANAIAFTLTGAPPDELLTQAAEDDSLRERARIAAEVERLLTPLDQAQPMLRFLRQYVAYPKLPARRRNVESALADALVADADALLSHWLREHGRAGFLEAFLAGEGAFASSTSAAVYGASVDSVEPQRVATERRWGIFTQPAWLATQAKEERNDPVHRGLFLRETLLCRPAPVAPVDVAGTIEVDEGQTLREALAEHTEGSCRSCHDRMDSLALPFEQYDHFGRYRREEAGRPVQTTGAILDSDVDGDVAGPQELLVRLAGSEQVRACFVRHAFAYLMGRLPSAGDELAIRDAVEAFRSGDLVALAASLFTSDTFLLRREREPDPG